MMKVLVQIVLLVALVLLVERSEGVPVGGKIKKAEWNGMESLLFFKTSRSCRQN